jgi:putative heme-binding domain-containing protein
LQRLRDLAAFSTTARRTLSPEEMASRVEQVKRYGDAARGEAIFRSATTGCFKCHAIGGAGGQLGPDLGSIGASSPIDYLIDSLLDPNKAIKDGYQSTIVTTKDNDVISGIKVSQDDKQMILRDAVQDHIVVPLDKVKNERPGGSLMPTGLTDPLPSWEYLNLIRFPLRTGQARPVRDEPRAAGAPMARACPPRPLEKLRPIRRRCSRRAGREAAVGAGVQPGQRRVPARCDGGRGQQFAFARAEIDVTTPGRVGCILARRGLSMWVDETPRRCEARHPDRPAARRPRADVQDRRRRARAGIARRSSRRARLQRPCANCRRALIGARSAGSAGTLPACVIVIPRHRCRSSSHCSRSPADAPRIRVRRTTRSIPPNAFEPDIRHRHRLGAHAPRRRCGVR